jgi:hypothetical protein
MLYPMPNWQDYQRDEQMNLEEKQAAIAALAAGIETHWQDHGCMEDESSAWHIGFIQQLLGTLTQQVAKDDLGPYAARWFAAEIAYHALLIEHKSRSK